MSHYDKFRPGVDQFIKERITDETEKEGHTDLEKFSCEILALLDKQEQEEWAEWDRASLADLQLLEKEEEEGWDTVEKPKHYNSYPGVEVIDLTQHMNFCLGNVVKYVARAAFKGHELEDLRKAKWYLEKEIERLTKDAE